MKKNKKLIIIVSLLVIVGMLLIINYDRYPSEKAYLNYLENKYNKDFIIKSIVNESELKDVEFAGVRSDIDLNNFNGYNVTLKENENINFIIGYGRFKVADWSLFY